MMAIKADIPFQPALPMRGVTVADLQAVGGVLFQPALPMRGVTTSVTVESTIVLFQPALPMRGVTRASRNPGKDRTDFNPHSPCGE